MPELVNFTPFPNFRYYSRDNHDDEFGVVIVKATYEFGPDGKLVVAEEQAPMLFTDRCHGEVNVSSLWHPSDLVPKKAGTDVIVNAIARTVGGVAKPSWRCGIAIDDGSQEILAKHLAVTGPRVWQPKWRRQLTADEARDWRRYQKLFIGWELSEPQPVTSVPLRYEFAYGGEIETGTDDNERPIFDTDQRNPLGMGKIHGEWTDHTKPVIAPQVEAVEQPIADPKIVYTPESLGPIPPAWLPRRPRGGTYDQDWMDNRWPAWPEDYSFSYHNSAHPDLIATSYLMGNERISLTGLSEDADKIEFLLPGIAPQVDLHTADGDMLRAVIALDTVFLDIAAASQRYQGTRYQAQ